ncbi:MAG: ATP-binding protein [bacterium]|nr:ATP-binding protein [bacterium]MDN5835336.1 ATP-binding protein [bacterium]
MKSLSLAKPHLLIVVGVPGSGKSFFAEKFADTFCAPFISFNTLRTQIIADPMYDRGEYEVLSRVATYILDETLKTKQTIVLEAQGATKTERLELAKKARKSGYEPLLVWVQVDKPTAKKRSIGRTRQASERMTAEQHATVLDRFTPPTDSEKYVAISGKHTSASQARVILKHLAVPRASAPVPVAERPIEPARRSNITIN